MNSEVERARFRRGLWGTAATLIVLSTFLALFGSPGLPRFYFMTQDIWVAGLYVMVLLACAAGLVPPMPRVEAVQLDMKRVAMIGAGLALLLWMGTYLIFFNYPLTRDEHMVVFDMAVFAEGRLAAPLPEAWRPFAQAMAPAFLLEMPGNAAWVSAYMPGNAALRAAFSSVADPALMNPLLAGIGFIALYDVARRLFPESRGAQAVALILYLSSAQMMAAAMTPYAMTGHLALNLVWLALFLRGGASGHAGAIAIGFVATGLHQVIFHPLFVLPFILLSWTRDERKRAGVYIAAYAAIGLFWILWPQLVAHSAGLEGTEAAAGSQGFLKDRVLPLLLQRDPYTLPLMGYNLLRFATWQNAALIPLVLIALPVVRREGGVARALWYGILLTFLAMAILLPYQGHGWGYRYFHGLIGSFALLAGYGWQRLQGEGAGDRRLLLAGTAATALVALPFQLWQAHAFVAPYARANAAMAKLDADFVLIDTGGEGYAADLVRNDPFLRNRPIRFSSWHLNANLLPQLCTRGAIAVVDGEVLRQFGINTGREPRGGPAWAAARRCGAPQAGRL